MDTQLKAKVQESNSCKKKLESEAEYKAKNLKEIKAQIQKCEKELAAAKKKYDAKQKTYNDIEMEVQAKRQMLSEYEKVSFTQKSISCKSGQSISFV
jgi:chromosome segregation ATPase